MKKARVISIINLKGGVSKTTTAINMSYILAEEMDKKVLLIDNDKQGNTTKFFGLHSYDEKSLADVYTQRGFDIWSVIKSTKYSNIFVIPANMSLLAADRSILIDVSRSQQTILSKALQATREHFDYVIIDNPPDLGICVVNSLVASDDIIVPIKIDQFSLDGVDQLLYQVEELKEFNQKINFTGCLITQFAHNRANADVSAWLKSSAEYPVYDSIIRRTVKVDESTFSQKPVCEHAPTSLASVDYRNFVQEYLIKTNNK